MRIASRIGSVVIAMLITFPVYSQLNEGRIQGKVIDRDGKPIQGAEVRVESQGTHQQDVAKTNKNGDYSLSGLYSGNYKAYLFVNGKPVMVKGDGVGNELSLNGGGSLRVNFDMKDAPETGVAISAAPAAKSSADSKEKAAADKKANDEMKAAFDAGVAALKANQFEEAVKQFQLASEKNKTQPAIFGNMGLALEKLKRYDEAAAAYRSSLAL